MYKLGDNIHKMWYNVYMKERYKKTKTTEYLINYHFVFCPRYRRKIFLIEYVEERFKELVKIKCKALEIEVIDIQCNEDHVNIYLNCLPTQSPSDIMNAIKSYTGRILREEFHQLSKMPSLWTRGYLVSTEEDIYTEVITDYIESQRTRY